MAKPSQAKARQAKPCHAKPSQAKPSQAPTTKHPKSRQQPGSAPGKIKGFVFQTVGPNPKSSKVCFNPRAPQDIPDNQNFGRRAALQKTQFFFAGPCQALGMRRRQAKPSPDNKTSQTHTTSEQRARKK